MTMGRTQLTERRHSLKNFSRSIVESIARKMDFVGRHADLALSEKASKDEARSEAEALYMQARTMMRAGKAQEALLVFAQVHAISPTFEDGAEAYAERLDQAGRSELARSMYDLHRH